MNENEIEHQLRQVPLAQPSAGLDQRMRGLFHDATAARPRLLVRPVPVWMVAAACLGCVVAGFGARSLFASREKTSKVVYVLPASEALTRLLTGQPSVTDNGLDFSHPKVQVITKPLQPPDQL
jgi:hypothetical protein